MKEFNLFRINCWLEDLDGETYENSILAIVYEILITKDNLPTTRGELYEFITKKMGIKVQIDSFNDLTSKDKKLLKEPIKEDVLISIVAGEIESFKEKFNRYSIEHHIKQFVAVHSLDDEIIVSIRKVLFKSLYININTFTSSNLNTLLSEDIKSDFNSDEIENFNNFLSWDDSGKNKAIYSLFSKSVEFAILTSGRGVSSVGSNIFSNKEYYLDTNIIIRALGVDGSQRQESIITILDSCTNSGVKLKISKATYDEINGIIDRRSKQINLVTSVGAEKILMPIIDDLPLNSSFETDYLKKRSNNIVSSPSRYRLHLEEELQKIFSLYNINVVKVKGLVRRNLTDFSNYLFLEKTENYGKRNYSKGAAHVDAINILHVEAIRGGNNYNYKDIKSFYLTTDATLNEITSKRDKSKICETILPSQLYIIHNSFSNKSEEEDYADFIKYIKLRKTDFKLPGQDIYRYLEQIRPITSISTDVKSSIIAYCNYKFKNGGKRSIKSSEILSIDDFTASLFEEELSKKRKDAGKYIGARKVAILKLDKYENISKVITYAIELLLICFLSVSVMLITKSIGYALSIILVIIVFRTCLFFLRQDFGFHKFIKDKLFTFFAKRTSFYKIYPDDEVYNNEINLRK